MDITYLGIFLEGLLSFLSPCVLPLLPLYMSYLAGEDKEVDEEGNIRYNRLKVFVATVFFVLGICLTFVLLSLSVDLIRNYIDDYSEIVSIIGGTLLIVFALHEMGLIHIDILDREHKLKINLHLEKMNFIKAFLLGFVFSLGWSPCIGPMLSNALLLSATSSEGYIYLLLYGLGLIIPFLITGLMTSTILNLLNKKGKIMKTVMIVSGIVMMCFGGYMIANASKQIIANKNMIKLQSEDPSNMSGEQLQDYLCNYEFHDQNGNKIHINDYEGKYVYLNFVASWCGYCMQEIPEYHAFASSTDEAVCLYVMSPLVSNEKDADGIKECIKDRGITLPVIIDEEGLLPMYLGVYSFPKLYIVHDGRFICYADGMMGKDEFSALHEYAKGLE